MSSAVLVPSITGGGEGLDHLFIYCNFYEFDSRESDELGIGNRFFSILLAPVSVSASSSFGGSCALLRHIN